MGDICKYKHFGLFATHSLTNSSQWLKRKVLEKHTVVVFCGPKMGQKDWLFRALTKPVVSRLLWAN